MTLFEMSVSGAVLIAVILLLRRGLLYRLPKWTFLLLWGVALCRLLIPFSLPSPVSVYTGAARAAQAIQKEQPTPPPLEGPVIDPSTPLPEGPSENAGTPALPPAPAEEPIPLLPALRLAGTALCALLFAAAYGRSLLRFRSAVPAEDEFIARWQREHPTLFPIRVSVSSAVNAPLAYGLLRPTILLPQNTDWIDREQLTYILTHEYVHIRRGDLLWKLLLTAALCLHWFNPLVWAMYFCANRDLELACDEAVVRILGPDSRKGYAYALLSAQEGRFSPLCTTYAAKSHMEERIRSIMKLNQKSITAMLAALLLVAGVTAVFATSQMPSPEELAKLPMAAQSDPPPASSSSPVQRPAISHPEENQAGTLSVLPRDNDIVPGPGDAVGAVNEPEPDNRKHPITDTPTEPDQVLMVDGDDCFVYTFNKDDPVEFWGLPEGPIARGTALNAHTEEEYREMIRQLRIKGYNGSWVLTGQPDENRYIVILDRDYDGVQRELTPPDGITADWRYPVNSKGETYGVFTGYGVLGYEPDLMGYVASNGQSGYITLNDRDFMGYPGSASGTFDLDYQAWLKTQPSKINVPVYDVDRDNIVGYFEFTNERASDYTVTQERQDQLVETVESTLRKQGYSEERIAQEVERVRREHPVAPPEMTLDEKREAYGW